MASLTTMPKWFELQPCNETFLTTAPMINQFSVELPVSSKTAWLEMTQAGALSWCTFITGSRYLTPQPLGVGAVRELSMMPSSIKAKEHYFLWDETPNRRYRNTFYVTAFTVPGLHIFAEDVLIEQLAAGCRLTWTFAIDPKPRLHAPLKFGSTIITNALRRNVNDTKTYFDGLSTRSHS
ncbi:SRPBCC family protein [Rhodococcus erythropolis]|uniref:SRPBCC family protein n=1 Tax=Rhodococcus erythropolis TaxID=1833 RepID=UPI003D0C3A63